jgi:hypothetical protein
MQVTQLNKRLVDKRINVRCRYSLCLLYWYKSAHTDADGMQRCCARLSR